MAASTEDLMTEMKKIVFEKLIFNSDIEKKTFLNLLHKANLKT